MEDFISESITPRSGAFNTAAMGRAEPGLPPAFSWRGTWYEVAGMLESWKHFEKSSGQKYLRRHYFKLKMTDGSTWTVYFIRHARKAGSPLRRWFLLNSTEPASHPPDPSPRAD